MAIISFDKAEVYPHGILGQATTVLTPNDERWINGFEAEYTRGGVKVSVGGDGCDSRDLETIIDNPDRFTEGHIFSVVSEISCSTMGMSPDELARQLNNTLRADLQYAIEREFWAIAPNTQYTGPGQALVEAFLGSALDPSASFREKVLISLAAAEEYVGFLTPGRTGTIHLPPSISSVARLRKSGSEIRTHNDSKVVIGQGYSEDPIGDKIVVTGDVTVVLGDPVIRGGRPSWVTTSNNSVRVIVDTPAALVWDSPSTAIIEVL